MGALPLTASRFTTCDECESVDACHRLGRCAKGWFRAAYGRTNTAWREEVEADGIYAVVRYDHRATLRNGEAARRRKR